MTQQICDWLRETAGALTAVIRMEDAAPYVLPGKMQPPGSTLILAAVPYYAGQTEGSVSLYARGRDYHLVLRRLFADAAAAAHAELCGTFADTSPFRETALASAAGLGQLGQNGLLLTKPYGSFVFLGELCGDFPGETVTLRAPEPCCGCGACRRACPAAPTCLSEITQRRGTLTEEEQAMMRRYHTAWGCDICQTVCPANKQVQKSKLPAFCEELISDFDYESLKNLSNRAIERLYADRAFIWRGGAVIRRNAAILAGQDVSAPDHRPPDDTRQTKTAQTAPEGRRKLQKNANRSNEAERL